MIYSGNVNISGESLKIMNSTNKWTPNLQSHFWSCIIGFRANGIIGLASAAAENYSLSCMAENFQ